MGRLPGPSQASVGQGSEDHPQLATESICGTRGHCPRFPSSAIPRHILYSAFPSSIMIPSSVLDQHKYLSILCKRMAHPDDLNYLPTKNVVLDYPLCKIPTNPEFPDHPGGSDYLPTKKDILDRPLLRKRPTNPEYQDHLQQIDKNCKMLS